MIKFDTKACMVIVSKDEIKYETRVSNFIAFGSPWPIQSSRILKYYKYKLLTTKTCIYGYETVIVFACADSKDSDETGHKRCCV